MKIAIDINGIFAFSGIGRYIANLINELARIDHNNQYLLSGTFWGNAAARRESPLFPKQDNFKVEIRRFPESMLRILETDCHVPLTENSLCALGIDVFHGTGNIIPRLNKIRSIVTIHHVKGEDPSDKKTPSSLWDKYYYSHLTSFSVRSAGHIIADSENTRKDIVSTYGRPQEDISVIYPGIRTDVEQYAQCQTAPAPFILFIGPVNDRKNLIRLIQSLAIVEKHDLSLPLIITGPVSDEYRSIALAVARDAGVKARITFTGPIPSAELYSLYHEASLLAYPSLFEGFGYPPIEAMMRGCPVVASNVTSIPEVCGDAAWYVDPRNTSSIADGIFKVATDPVLRDDLIQKGKRRVVQFSVIETARTTLALYQKMAFK